MSRGDHFYTTDPSGELAPSAGYDYEGIAFALFASPAPGTVPLYRWWSPYVLDHFYTIDPSGELAPSTGYTYEGIVGYVYAAPAAGAVPLYRWWSPTATDHFYTTDPSGELAPSTGYLYEGIACWVLPPSAALPMPAPDAGPAPGAPPCPPGQVRVNGVCVGDGSLRFTLTWDHPGDVDLHVVTPSGREIYYAASSADSGRLDRDDTSGTGPENVFWETSPPAGTYLVCVNAYSISTPTGFRLTVARDGVTQETRTGMRTTNDRSACSASSPNLVTTFTVR
jgi:hypothetical protein